MKHLLGWSRAKIRESRFPMSMFWIIAGGLFAILGTHSGLVIGIVRAEWPTLVIVHVMVGFWMGVSLIMTLIIRRRIEETYDAPLQTISEATKKVAQGDFSVYVAPVHSPERMDYLDRMFLDFNTMVEDLGSIETMKTDFIANVSHEIKTPLSVISNYAQLLKNESLPPERRQEYVDIILRNVQRLADLVGNILKLNKLENQVIAPAAEPYDLCAQLSECALLFEDVWERGGISFIFETEDRCVIRGDREMLELVWNNLLSNAFKFTPPGGEVRLTQSSDASGVTVTVSDTGCGMTEETMSRIFEKFYQGDPSHAQPGNGLGLALVRRTLQIFGGSVTVQSAPDQGSSFTVRLPK